MKETITLKRINALYCQVKASDSILYDLRDYFSFRPDGYKFMGKYKSGLWDGYIRLFTPTFCKLHQGLLDDFIGFAIANGYAIKFDNGNGIIDVKHDGIGQWLESWPYWCKFEPYDYQLDAVETMIKRNRALCISPTGSGKSLIVYSLCRYLLQHTDDKILITVPTTQLVEQMAKDFADYEVDTDTIKPSKEAHKIYSGQSHNTDKRIVITTWQSVYKKPPEWFKQFGAYICDEAHLASAASITSIVENLQHSAQYRFGVTGTLNGTKCHEMQLKALFGSIVKTQTTRELMDSGVLADIDVKCLVYEYHDAAFVKELKQRTENAKPQDAYLKELNKCLAYTGRQNALMALCLSRNANTLVLFNFIDSHGLLMFEQAKSLAESFGKEVFYIDGNTSVIERELIRSKFDTQNNIVLFASYGTFSAGINIKNVHHLILSHPTKSVIRILQSVGRVLRKSDGKSKAYLYDIVDDIAAGKKTKGILYNQFVNRLEIYEAQEFPYTIKTVEIR